MWSMQDYIYITFYYLTNKNDSSVVSSVSTGELIGYPEDPYFFRRRSSK